MFLLRVLRHSRLSALWERKWVDSRSSPHHRYGMIVQNFSSEKRGRKTQRNVSFISPSLLNERRKKRNKNAPDLTGESNSADMAYSLIIYLYSTGMVPAPCNRLFSATPSQRAGPNIYGWPQKKKCQHPQAGPYKCCLNSKIYYSKDHLSPGSIPLCKRGPCII